MQDPHLVTFTLILPASQAWALARWLQRLTFDDCLAHALDRQQAWDMYCAGRAILEALRDAGIAPH